MSEETERAEGGIELIECGSCHRRWQTRYAGCPYCGSADFSPFMASGSGSVYSWVTIHRPMAEQSPPTPYTVVTIDLAAGARVFARLLNHDHELQGGENVECFVDWLEPGLRARFT